MACLETLSTKTLERAIKWAQINSGSTNVAGCRAVLTLALKELNDWGFSCEQKETLPVESLSLEGSIEKTQYGPVLVARHNPQIKRRVLLSGHIDTVFQKNSHFQTIKHLETGLLNGPGLADMKTGVSIMLAAIEALVAENKTLGIDVVLNSDEEVGTHASRPILESMAKQASFALAYEPALPDGGFAGQRAGSGNLSFLFKGKSAHAGREFLQGRNAVAAAARLGVFADDYWRGKDGLNLTLAALRGGQTFNVVPDQAVSWFNMRSLDKSQLEEAFESLLGEAGIIAQKFDVHVENFGALHRPVKPVFAKQTQLENIVSNICQNMRIPHHFQDTQGVCDGNIIAATGTPIVDTMGARGGNIHTDQEFIDPTKVPERIKLNIAVVKKLLNGTPQ